MVTPRVRYFSERDAKNSNKPKEQESKALLRGHNVQLIDINCKARAQHKDAAASMKASMLSCFHYQREKNPSPQKIIKNNQDD